MTPPHAAPGETVLGIGQISIHIEDLDRAVRFYHETLGLPLLFRIPGAAFLDCGGIRLYLAAAEKPEFDHPASIIYYRVADIRAAHESLGARGVTFEGDPHLIARMPDHELWMAFLRDTEGNLLALMSEVREGAASSGA